MNPVLPPSKCPPLLPPSIFWLSQFPSFKEGKRNQRKTGQGDFLTLCSLKVDSGEVLSSCAVGAAQSILLFVPVCSAHCHLRSGETRGWKRDPILPPPSSPQKLSEVVRLLFRSQPKTNCPLCCECLRSKLESYSVDKPTKLESSPGRSGCLPSP